MADPWLLLQSGPGEPAWNMALDEALLEQAPHRGRPLLRFYGWIRPAATFGYFQRFAEVAGMTPLRPLIRRPTGGGLVPHDGDWTYSVIIPPAHSWHTLRAADSYQRLHQWMRDAFARLGVATLLAPCEAKEAPGRCFAGPDKADLLWRERKIAGAAQRRTRRGLLIQGSVQPPPGVAKIDWQQALCDAAGESFNAAWKAVEGEALPHGRAGELVRERYGQRSFNERR
jgi:lipoyl(octanoyl) transferase